MTKRSETLHEALAAFNIRSFPGTIPGKRRLVQFGEYEIGEFGFYLSTGTLLAVYSVAGKLLTYKAAAARVLQKFTLDISPLPAQSVTVVVGSDNLNILLSEEIATLATANIDNMARHVGLMFRVMALEAK